MVKRSEYEVLFVAIDQSPPEDSKTLNLAHGTLNRCRFFQFELFMRPKRSDFPPIQFQREAHRLL